jgi:hypothetical protein
MLHQVRAHYLLKASTLDAAPESLSILIPGYVCRSPSKGIALSIAHHADGFVGMVILTGILKSLHHIGIVPDGLQNNDLILGLRPK